jgi:hypothetical protein
MPDEALIVDNRVFLLGLDKLFRTAMQRYEIFELLPCAQAVAKELSVRPSTGPVEGYYAESPPLTEYFHLVRALQAAPNSLRTRVRGQPEFQRLEEVVSSRIFGEPVSAGGLLPMGRDPLSQALIDLPLRHWSIKALVRRASEVARQKEDYSLVGLAALAEDPVMLAALRESVVLYAEVAFGAPARPEDEQYAWAVDNRLETQATRFVKRFNSLFGEDLPDPAAGNAGQYWRASQEASVVDRCVRIGEDPHAAPIRYYHWAVTPAGSGEVRVEEFWDVELWTTERYSKSRPGRNANRPEALG